ncbi:hypothetical protein I3843_04G127400 [Carya illinoinensis]|nr:hypothetical protein I3843_04G127400 [Carya illinoinensis]
MYCNWCRKQGHSEGSSKSKNQYNMKRKKKMDSVDNGKGLETKVWKVVGEKKTKEKVQAGNEKQEISSSRRQAILDRIAQKQSIALSDQMETLFMDANGVLFSQTQALLEDKEMKRIEDTQLTEHEEERDAEPNIYGSQSAGKLSWFEESEKLDEKDEGDGLVHICGSPRSSLKLIDEALEGEVCCNAIGHLWKERMNGTYENEWDLWFYGISSNRDQMHTFGHHAMDSHTHMQKNAKIQTNTCNHAADQHSTHAENATMQWTHTCTHAEKCRKHSDTCRNTCTHADAEQQEKKCTIHMQNKLIRTAHITWTANKLTRQYTYAVDSQCTCTHSDSTSRTLTALAEKSSCSKDTHTRWTNSHMQ